MAPNGSFCRSNDVSAVSVIGFSRAVVTCLALIESRLHHSWLKSENLSRERINLCASNHSAHRVSPQHLAVCFRGGVAGSADVITTSQTVMTFCSDIGMHA